jgi:hypothetical protein
MARIELRDATIRIRDGLAGTAAVADMSTMAGDTGISVDTVSLNTADTDHIPVGARFTIAGETGLPVHTVLTRTGNPTTAITFTPALAAGVMDDAVITFLPQQIEVKIGEGNLTYTENKEYEYLLDKGDLDTVREGNQVPMDVVLEFVYEFVRTGTSEAITPVDAIKGIGGASEWVSSANDLCQPYAVDVVVEHEPPCGNVEAEETIFPDFRADTLEFNLNDATISATGRCNATQPTISRS